MTLGSRLRRRVPRSEWPIKRDATSQVDDVVMGTTDAWRFRSFPCGADLVTTALSTTPTMGSD